jgi:hypothetical protein
VTGTDHAASGRRHGGSRLKELFEKNLSTGQIAHAPASLFLGHGSPMTLIEPSPTWAYLAALPGRIEESDAILVISTLRADMADMAAGTGAEDHQRRVHPITIPRRVSATRSTSSSAMPG